MKAKDANIQKSYAFTDPMYIFSENGSISQITIFSEDRPNF